MMIRRFETNNILGQIVGHECDRYDLCVWLLDCKDQIRILPQLSSLKFPVQVEDVGFCISLCVYYLTYDQAERFLKTVCQIGRDDADWPKELDIPGD